jgi:hypothetical protein
MTKNGIPKPDVPIMRSSMQQAAANEKGQPAIAAPPAQTAIEVSPDATVAPARPTNTPRPKPRPQQKASLSAPDTASKRLSNSRDILLSLPEDLKDRMVNTIAWTNMHTGISHQQKFIRLAIEELCERLESDHNHGKPFPEAAKPVA